MLKRISFYFVTFLLLLLKYFTFFCGRRARNIVGQGLGKIGFTIWKSRRNITIENLTFAFDDKTPAEIRTIALNSFQSIAISLIELLSLNKISDKTLAKMIDWGDGVEWIKQVYARNKGCLFLSGHFGNWELIAYSVGKYTALPITIVVKPQANYVVDKFLNDIRTSSGNQTVSMYNAARTIINVIKNGEIVALLADQAGTEDKDIYIKFFGRKASTFKVVAELALRYEIPIVMGFAIRQPDGKYKVELNEIDYSDLLKGNTSNNYLENVKTLTERHTQLLEATIRRYPAQWAWMHKRWKHRQFAVKS